MARGDEHHWFVLLSTSCRVMLLGRVSLIESDPLLARPPASAHSVARPSDGPGAWVGGRSGEAELETQMLAALDAIRAAALRLLREGEVHPQLIVLAAARVAGELGAGAALAGGMEVETLLGELAEVVRLAGREHADTLQAETLPVAGNA